MPSLSVVWPPALVVVVVSFVYVVFMLVDLVPQLMRALGNPASDDPNTYTPSVAEIGILMGVFHAVFFLMAWSFVKTSTTPPGDIPVKQNPRFWVDGDFGISAADEARLYEMISDVSFTGDRLAEQREFLRMLPVVERKVKKRKEHDTTLLYRYCTRCQCYKPDRTHHCRICQRCVLRMDHHCPWVANCIGNNNYKFFLLFITYTWLCIVIVAAGMLRRFIKAFRPVIDSGYFLSHDLPVIVAYTIVVFLGIALGLFGFFHMGLTASAMTTIESREKKSHDDPSIVHRWEIANTKFSMGSRMGNFKHILGPRKLTWWLPTAYTAGDGTYSTMHLDLKKED